MALDPQAAMFLEAFSKAGGPEPWEVAPDVARNFAAQRRAAMPPGPAAIVEDHLAPCDGGPILVRVYKPLQPTAAAQGCLVWFHGGGFVLGSVRESDRDCRQIAHLSGCAVGSVDYRCAPEHVFPAASDDCYAATSWIHAHARELGLDPARIAVGGDSAGGNLATGVAMRARERGAFALRFQVLLYPVTDLASFDTPSYHEFADGYFLTKRTMLWFRDHYVPNAAEQAHPLASPLRAAELSGLPPALVITPENDPLRDEGEAYAERLATAGVRVMRRRWPGMIHGFVSMFPYLDSATLALQEIAAALRTELG
jgi:acetyl esterase